MACSSPSLTHLPPDLVDAVRRQAELDGDRVGLLLTQLLGPVEKGTIWFPEWFLLELAAALRLQSWEKDGITLHLDAGLPSSEHAIASVAQALTDRITQGSHADDAPLTFRVNTLFIERFAWRGRADLDAEVVLGEADGDELVEVLARLMWAHRTALRHENPAL
jgi:hypothetical protein